jgi:hypothetical protein
MDKDAYEKLPDIVGVIEEFYGLFGLDEGREQALLAHVRSIKGQLYQAGPDDRTVREHLSAIRELLRPQADSELAAAAVKEIDRMIAPRKGNTQKEAAMNDVEEKTPGPAVAPIVLAAAGVLAGVALAGFGVWLVDDGLLGGYVADRKEMGIGVAFLAAGVFLLMMGARGLLRRRPLRVALGVAVLVAVVAFALSEASRAAEQSETVDVGRDAVYVTIRESGLEAPMPPEAVRPAKWYESGVVVLVERSFQEKPMTVPQKFVVPIGEQ